MGKIIQDAGPGEKDIARAKVLISGKLIHGVNNRFINGFSPEVPWKR
ncbi:MAG: hypothetical protein WHS38_06960 [Thermodesulforhabdaceae bacterium]|jgi:hypothetical protein